MPRPAYSTVGFVVVLLVGLGARLLLLPTVLGFQNSDLSIVYLMARRFAEGDFQIFYWGQHYGGTLLQLSAGALFRVTGPSFWVFAVVEIGYWLVASLLLRSIMTKSSGVLAGNTAGSLLWMASPDMLSFSFHDPGFYGPTAVLGLLAVRIAQCRGHPGRPGAAAIGLVSGLALWTAPLAFALVLPSVLWVGWRLRSMQLWLIAAGCAVVGASPWLWANARSGLASLERQGSDPSGDVAGRYWRVFSELVPGVMSQSADSAQGRAAVVLFLVTLVAGAVVALRRRRTGVVLLCISALLVPAVVAVSGVEVVPLAARYATLLVPAVAAVLGWAVGRHWTLATVCVTLVSAWTLNAVSTSTSRFERVPGSPFGAPVEAVGRYLEKRRETSVWADYWIAYLLTAATHERMTAAAIAPPVYRRRPSYEVAAAREPETTVVLFAGKENDVALKGQAGLPPSRRMVLGPYAVWHFEGRLDVLKPHCSAAALSRRESLPSFAADGHILMNVQPEQGPLNADVVAGGELRVQAQWAVAPQRSAAALSRAGLESARGRIRRDRARRPRGLSGLPPRAPDA